LQTVAITNYAKRQSKYQELVGALPEVNRAILRVLLPFLDSIRENCSENKMTAGNVGVVFGPMLLRAQELAMAGTPQELKDTFAKQSRIVEELIAFRTEIFPENEKKRHVGALPPLPARPLPAVPPQSEQQPVAVSMAGLKVALEKIPPSSGVTALLSPPRNRKEVDTVSIVPIVAPPVTPPDNNSPLVTSVGSPEVSRTGNNRVAK